jgi:hypothetical protein
MTVNFLPHVSKFLIPVSPIDIDFEQQQLEAMHKVKLRAYSVEHGERSGSPVMLITWEIIE